MVGLPSSGVNMHALVELLVFWLHFMNYQWIGVMNEAMLTCSGRDGVSVRFAQYIFILWECGSKVCDPSAKGLG